MKYLSSLPQISTVMQHQNLKHKQTNKQAWWTAKSIEFKTRLLPNGSQSKLCCLHMAFWTYCKKGQHFEKVSYITYSTLQFR